MNKDEIVKIVNRYGIKSSIKQLQFKYSGMEIKNKHIVVHLKNKQDKSIKKIRLIHIKRGKNPWEKSFKESLIVKNIVNKLGKRFSDIKKQYIFSNDLGVKGKNRIVEIKNIKTGEKKICRLDNLKSKVCPFGFDADYREKRLQNKIYKDLIKNRLKDIEVFMEYKIPKRDNLNGRIDFLIQNKKTGKFIGLELKHGDSNWNLNDIKRQMNKYNRAFREKKGYCGSYLISNNGKYGEHLSSIRLLIQKIL